MATSTNETRNDVESNYHLSQDDGSFTEASSYGRGGACTAKNESTKQVPMSPKSKSYSPLVSSCRHLLKPNGSIIGDDVARSILPLFPSFCSAIPADVPLPRNIAALASIDGRKPISHARVRDFVLSDFGPALHKLGFGRKDRIAIVLPNGPELALSIVSIINWASCVPLNAVGARSELEIDLKGCNADLVIGPFSGPVPVDCSYTRAEKKDKHSKFHVPGATDIDSAEFLAFDYVREIALKLGIPFVGLLPSRSEAGIFELIPPIDIQCVNITPQESRKFLQDEADAAGSGISKPTRTLMSSTGSDSQLVSRQLPNTHDDEVLVLFTSGTTGSKKLVPHRLGEILVATATISVSWDLTPADINCNLMPLFHVGGIVRQIFSPLLSGGCVICCPTFDPSIFWALMTKKAFTWYYAAPTMHQIILQTGKEILELNNRSSNLEQQTKPKLRMIANAAGGLLPSLAIELRKTFHANVLPSYGMTECMPISSPPANYELGRPGTSGVAVGPEIAILDMNTGKPLPEMTDGPICVRGSPCFRGYGHNHSSSEQRPAEANASFLPGGWFNTGDLGYMDKDGYLYITGRSKEVINRGGEIISPLDVEEAVVAHPDVIACAAFSAKHDVLQESVGIVIVPAKDKPRIDLHSLHDFLGQERLVAAKWPQCIVFMDALPKNHTNKLLRVKLAQRLGLPELNDGMYPIERTFEATCPPQGTPVKVAIPVSKVKVHPRDVQSQLVAALDLTTSERIFVTHHPTRIGALVCYCTFIERTKVLEVAELVLHKYVIPTHFVQFDTIDMEDIPYPVAKDSTSAIKQGLLKPSTVDALTEEIQDLYLTLLDLDCRPHPDENFFNLGGNSMLASQLAAKLRKKHSVPLSGAEVFHNSSCNHMASVVRERQHQAIEAELSVSGSDNSVSGTSSTTSRKDLDLQGAHFTKKRKDPRQNNFINFYQLMPLVAIFPTWQLTRFFLFFCTLVRVSNILPWDHSFLNFVVSAVIFHLSWIIIMPLIFVMIKWGVVGKYKAGRYPIWGPTYLRWWFVDVCRNVIGRGIYGSTEHTLNWYYRLLGAQVGKDARISIACDIAEYDLVEIGEGAAIDDGTLRGFALDNGCMLLGPVAVGNYASIGLKCIVAPNTSVMDHCHLGPQASSYETGKSISIENGKYNRYNFPDPHPLLTYLICTPLVSFCNIMSHVPAMILFYIMLSSNFHHEGGFQTVGDVVAWLCVPQRIPFYLAIRVVRAILAPLVYMICAVGVKRVVIGKFEPGPVDLTSQWQLIRHYLSASLFTRESLRDVTEIIGRHFECVSILYRMLGAKVGERVFWPGSQIEFTGEFDLLEIGDDVVFGSRSAIICRSTESLEMVRLCAGCNVADNCIVMPGVIMGKNSVLGSSGIAPPGWYFPESSVWFGSRYCEPVLLEKGVEDFKFNEVGALFSAQIPEEKLQFHGDETTIRPFGKAFYKGEAMYKVYPLWFMISLGIVIISLTAILHALPILYAVHGVGGMLYGWPIADRQYQYSQYPSIVYYILLTFMYIITHNLRVMVWLGIEIGSKWALMKQRAGGRYNWDVSTYNQRWEIYQLITRVRRIARYSFFDFLHGTPYFVTFFRHLGCTIGDNVCLYPTGGDPYMTEPDLVTIGDNCAIDQAALVCHLNTRGNFELNPIEIGDNVTLRNKSRIQMGSKIEKGSMLLEHSLAMTGEIIEAESVWQGAPATPVFYYVNMEKRTWEPYVPDPFGGGNIV